MIRTIKIETENLEAEMKRYIAEGYKKEGYCYWTAILTKNNEKVILERP